MLQVRHSAPLHDAPAPLLPSTRAIPCPATHPTAAHTIQHISGAATHHTTAPPPDPTNTNATTRLQVVKAADVSRPSVAGVAGAGAHRMLMLKLTDGKASCKAAEFKAADALLGALVPGTKVLLSSASVKAGVVLLEPKCIK